MIYMGDWNVFSAVEEKGIHKSDTEFNIILLEFRKKILNSDPCKHLINNILFVIRCPFLKSYGGAPKRTLFLCYYLISNENTKNEKPCKSYVYRVLGGF
jgi:hypothetical protein